MTNGTRATVGFAPSNAVISTYAYTLDGVGNRTRTDLNEPMMPSYNAETINYTYTLGNILASADGATYTHDANGNRTTKTNGTNITTYTYDSLNRLTQVATSSRTIQYIYSGLGQRIGKIDNSVQTNYLVDPNGLLPQVLAETDANNNLIAFYVYDGAGLVAKISASNNYYFYHYDGLGSTIAITDNNGQVVNTYCYSPEGLVGVQETIANPFTYVGRFGVMAEGNGHYYMGARYYDPEVGRFINKDPIGFVDGLNLFTYVENNYINLIDPLGLLMVTLKYSNSPFGSVTMVWNSWLPSFYRSGTVGDTAKEIKSGVYQYKYGQHPMVPTDGRVPYPALNIYTLAENRTLPATLNGKETTASGVNFHRGNSLRTAKKTGKIGSTACHAIPYENWDDFISNFKGGKHDLYFYFRLW